MDKLAPLGCGECVEVTTMYEDTSLVWIAEHMPLRLPRTQALSVFSQSELRPCGAEA